MPRPAHSAGRRLPTLRILAALLLAGTMLALVPVAPAATGTGGAYGVRSGDCDVGGWDLWWLDVAAGALTIQLQWADGPLFVDADYDLLVYRWSDYADDGALTEAPLFAKETRSFTVREERLDVNVAAGRYVIAVVPHQAQGDRYTLSTSHGFLTDTYPAAPGARLYSPWTYCVF